MQHFKGCKAWHNQLTGSKKSRGFISPVASKKSYYLVFASITAPGYVFLL